MSESELMLRAELALLKLAADLMPHLPEEGLHIQTQAGLWRIGMAIGPAMAPVNGGTAFEPEEKRLSPCERVCLEIVTQLIEQTGHRQTAREIDTAIRASGQKPWGWATLTAALSNLVAMELLVNPKDKRGYGLPEATEPMEKHPAA